MTGERSERAGAKVTLSLRVTGTRSDGYHELDALVAIVDEPYDEVSIIEGAHDSEFVVDPRDGAPGDATNLVWRARAALGSSAGLRVQKAIPAEAGLGGGSADAAATLRLLRESDDLFEMDEVAASLGADVPVCLRGGVARMRGIGEVIDAVVPPSHPTFLVLATPPLACATAQVYAAWDALGGPESPRVLAPPPEWVHATGDERPWRNDLEPAALRVEPRLADFRDALAQITGATPMLCGSGSTYYVLAPDRAQAAAAVSAIRERLAVRAVSVSTVGRTI